jgi:hypothetical protein
MQLAESPELAVLFVLEAALETTSHVLFAAHPELETADFCAEAPDLSSDALGADAVLTHVVALGAALQRYRALLRRRSALRLVETAEF